MDWETYIIQRLIFSINSGRSGSQYLAKLLDSAKEVTAFHEAEPKMIGKYLRLIEKNLQRKYKKRQFKGQFIEKQLAKLSCGQVYCNTTHMFIKTFYDVVMEKFQKNEVEVIILKKKLSESLINECDK